MNDENLKGHGFNDRSAEEVRECGRKGGKRSGEVRRQKADLRKAMQALLDGEYTQKNNDGTKTKISGAEAISKTIMKAAMNLDNKNWQSAVRFIMQLQEDQDAQKRTAEERKKAKLEIEKLQAETELLKLKTQQASGDVKHEGRLADLIEGLKDDIHEEATGLNAPLADGQTKKN